MDIWGYIKDSLLFKIILFTLVLVALAFVGSYIEPELESFVPKLGIVLLLEIAALAFRKIFMGKDSDKEK